METKKFTTKLNISENRLVKQDINTVTEFKGSNVFSVPLSERRLGALMESATKIYDEEEIHVQTPFSYDVATEKLTLEFNNEKLQKSSDNIPYINFDNPDETYTVEAVMYGSEPYLVEDVEFYSRYSGYEYDITITNLEFVDGKYTGVFNTYEIILVECKSNDYVGNNEVLIVNGFSKTDKIITNSIQYTEVKTINNPTNLFLSKDLGFLVVNSTINLGSDLPIGVMIDGYCQADGIITIPNNTKINTQTLKSQSFFKIVKISDKEFLVTSY